MLAASGETLCCGLFDIEAIETVGDRTIIWTDDVVPAAALNMNDANALTLAKILPKLTQEDCPETPRLIGVVETQPIAGSVFNRGNTVIILVAMAFGMLGATIPKLAAVGLMGLLPILPIAILFAIVIAVLKHRSGGEASSLAVFRTGLCIRSNNNSDDVEWDDLQSLMVTDQEVNVGTSKSPRHVTFYTLHINTIRPFSFGNDLRLSWPEEESTMTCTDYLRGRAK